MAPTFIQAGHKLKDIWMKQIESELAQAYRLIVRRNPSPLYMTLVDLLQLIRKLPTDYNNQFFNSIKIINKIFENQVVEQQNAAIQGKDLLSLLVMKLLEAGYETINTALSCALYFLAKHPNTHDCLRNEVLDVFTNNSYYPTFDEIENLKYLDCVFKETLRLALP
ncbi:22224_t:CDS:2, partial [Gigaspora margarita]